MIEKTLKEKIVEKLKENRENFFGSDAKFAISLGINNAQYSRIKKGDVDKVLSDANWIVLARRCGVDIENNKPWNTVKTPVYEFIFTQVEICKKRGLSSMLCDLSDIGKSEAVKHFCKTNTNAIYCDCSQVKSRQKMIRYIAKQFGIVHTGKYADVYEDLVFYIRSLPTPLIVIDEAGDLQYDAFLELKALWNATENCCAFYMVGADGLEEKIRTSIDRKKVGFTELFSRFGRRYGKAFVKLNKEGNPVPMCSEERMETIIKSAIMIIKANCKEGTDVNRVLNQCMGDDGFPSLRRIRNKLLND